MNTLPAGQAYESNPWVLCLAPRPFAGLRLFCFPHAGAGPLAYREWFRLMPSEIEVCGVRLPGRECRITEPPLRDLSTMVQRLAEGLAPRLGQRFALFGHSMGAIVAFELAHFLRSHGGPQPAHLFVSGHRAPHLPRQHEELSNLDDSTLLEELRKLGGSPEAALNHAELMDLLLPMLRADFAVCETYAYVPRHPLHCPITALGGLQDPYVDREQLEAWRQHTQGDFSVRMFAGDHFFPIAHPARVTQVLVQRMISHLIHAPT